MLAQQKCFSLWSLPPQTPISDSSEFVYTVCKSFCFLQPFACGLVNKLLRFSHQLQATQSASSFPLKHLSAVWQSSKIIWTFNDKSRRSGWNGVEKSTEQEEEEASHIESNSGLHQRVYASSQFIDTSVAFLLPEAYKTPPKPTQQWNVVSQHCTLKVLKQQFAFKRRPFASSKTV